MTRKPKTKGPTLAEYVETYIAEREVSPGYRDLLRRTAARFCKWCGRDIQVANMTCALVNKWLDFLKAGDIKPQTIQGYRRNIRSVWMAAYMDELCDEPPFRLKRIRCPMASPEAYSIAEIKKLVDAAKRLKGFARNGVRWSDLFPALILAGYSTGLRRGDLFLVMRSQIADDGRSTIMQHKTGFPVVVCFSPEAMEYIRRIQTDDGRAFPWPYHHNVFQVWWRRICKDGGVGRGQFRWLRRSAASYAEKQQPGLGSRMLGHRDPRMVVRHYADPAISAADPVALPAVG
jgi:integrase